MKATHLFIFSTLFSPLALVACGGESDSNGSGSSGDEVAQGGTGQDAADQNPETPGANDEGEGSPGSSEAPTPASSDDNPADDDGSATEGNGSSSEDSAGDPGENESNDASDDSSDMDGEGVPDESGPGGDEPDGNDEPVEIDPIGPGGGPAPERDSLTRAECEAAGGSVVGDPGDGRVHRADYICESSGEPPIGTIRAADGEPIFIEGAVCCGGKADPQSDVDCGQVECFRAIECVVTCGGPVRQSGCCPCPEGTFDSIDCDEEAESDTAGCAANSDCAPGEYCAKPAGACSASGECVAEPDACLDVYDPVCGCDGKSYSNSCQAASAGVNVGTGCDE